jgi:hypothetical protein
MERTVPAKIKGQDVDQDPLDVPENEGIEFRNQDSTDYFIQVFNENDDAHPVVETFVPKHGSGFVIVDGADGDTASFNIVDPRVLRRAKTKGGTHVIVITSATLAKKARRKIRLRRSARPARGK